METKRTFCTRCGAENIGEGRFCFKCGAQLTIPASAGGEQSAPSAAQPAKSLSSNSDFITLTCPTCGGKLSVTPNMERFACGYCGSEHIVRRSGGTVSIEPVMNKLNQINDNIATMGGGIGRMTAIAEKQAAEAAIKRLKSEITALNESHAKLYSNNTTGQLFFGISAVVFGFGLLVLYLNDGDPGILKVLGGFGAILGGFMTLIGAICWISIANDTKKRGAEYDKQVGEKQAQLKRNQEIVDR